MGKNVPVNAGMVTVAVEPESIYTITSTHGQAKGGFALPPAASAPFPLQWKDDFDSATVESLARCVSR